MVRIRFPPAKSLRTIGPPSAEPAGSANAGQAHDRLGKAPLGVRHKLTKDLPNGNRMVRHDECIVPNMFIIPSIREPGTAPKRKERGTELPWAVPVEK